MGLSRGETISGFASQEKIPLTAKQQSEGELEKTGGGKPDFLYWPLGEGSNGKEALGGVMTNLGAKGNRIDVSEGVKRAE